MVSRASEQRPIVVAIGGNSLTRPNQVGTIEEQRANAVQTCEVLADLLADGHRLVLTHGNGPQVGNVLLRVELAASSVYRLPLDICDGDTQGGIGYMLQQILGDELEVRGLPRRVATVVTQVVVDRDDPAFDNPTKPIGPYMPVEEAERRRDHQQWVIRRVDSRGYRRVVPSPRPTGIVEIDAIRAVFAAGFVPICVGGGGVPVYRGEDGRLIGLEAVIDKDLASSLVARELDAEVFVISTGVPQVLLDYEQPTERALDHLTPAEARRHLDDGQFPPGSMGPKVEAAVTFVEATGRRALITNPETLGAAMAGQGGTWIG